MDIRKIAIIFVIGALFAIFAFSTIDAIMENPEDEYCDRDYFEKPRIAPLEEDRAACSNVQPTREDNERCNDNEGYLIYDYDENGCAESFRCSCSEGYGAAKKNYELFVFLLYTVFATVGVGIGVFLPSSKNPLHEWVGTGFMLGGFICLFIGTIRYFEDMNKLLRPVIILIEMVLIIYLTYKKLGDIKKR